MREGKRREKARKSKEGRQAGRQAGKERQGRKASVIPFRRLLLPYMDLQPDNGARSFRPK